MIWIAALAVLALALLAWGVFEAGWLRCRVLDVEIDGLPSELDGLRIAHLSDLHLGVRSRGLGASEKAVAWVASRRPDLVCITGDLASSPKGVPLLVELLGTLDRPYVILGNHDVAATRDPFSQPADLAQLGDAAILLRDAAATIEKAGKRVQLVGVDPKSYSAGTARPWQLTDPTADFRILLCHFPGIERALQPGTFGLVLTGHLHAGQIVVPYPGGRVSLAHPGVRSVSGLHPVRGGVMHISPGTGTTFVPFRFFARPEVTELVLHPAVPGVRHSP
ncbi:MAG: hypothetical protein EXQ81_07255 [Thermoleophilia bacterium]|nr:hypothetical protein [Thermoleophilia bacterium]